MKNKLAEIIKNEDPKNPYTDELLASLLHIRRDRVTLLRKEMGIADSRERRRPALMKEIREILAASPNMTNVELTNLLQTRGYHLSRFIVGQTREQLSNTTEEQLEKGVTIPENAADQEGHAPHLATTSRAFENVVGAHGSLKKQIKQAKAAILYPPYGLHILISGATGVGKSSLVEAIHRFGIESGKLEKGAPLVVFNCADYVDNPQLLLSQLFGHSKGAFTGAATAKPGLVEKADHGILFLDEVHRLPPEGQEMLFYLIDNGKFRRLGDTDAIHSVSVMIIAATTEDIASSLLLTFRRRIPMFIELPLLSDRPLQERYEMIVRFTATEAAHIGSPILVTRDALMALMRYDCQGNVGQLRSDIQVACARGYLGHLSDGGEQVRVGLLELPFHVDSRMLIVGESEIALTQIAAGNLIVDGKNSLPLPQSFRKRNPFHGDIYQYLEERVSELQKQNVPTETINAILGEDTRRNFEQFLSSSQQHTPHVSFDEICHKFDSATLESLYVIRDILKKAEYPESDYLYYCMGVHLSATRKRLEEDRMVYNPHMPEIQERYPREYAMGLEIVKVLSAKWGHYIPEDEAGYLAMYLQLNQKQMKAKKRVGIVLASHGRVASSILEVVNHIYPKRSNITAVDFSFDTSPAVVLPRVIAAVQKVNQGRGVVLLVDMGSLARIGRDITEKSGIPVCVVERLETISVLRALEKANAGDTLEEVCTVDGKVPAVYVSQPAVEKKKAILTICVTGLGAAIVFKEMIEAALDPATAGNVDVLPIGYLNEQGLQEQVESYRQNYEIIAATGTICPDLPGIPFITMQELMDGKGLARLIYEVGDEHVPVPESEGTAFKDWKPFDIFRRDCIAIYDTACHKAMVIEHLCQLLQDAGCVTDQYMLDVYRREMLGPTVYRNGIAIPHGNAENVLHPTVAVAFLPTPIEWLPETMVDKVFLLALKEDSHPIMTRLCRIFEDKQFLDKVSTYRNPQEMKDALTEHILLTL